MQHIFEKQSQMSWIDVLCNTKIQNPKIETVWVSYVDVSKNYSSAGGLGIQYYSMVFILQGIFFCKAQAMIAERKILLCKLLSSGESETIEIKPCSTIVYILGVSGKRFRQLCVVLLICNSCLWHCK